MRPSCSRWPSLLCSPARSDSSGRPPSTSKRQVQLDPYTAYLLRMERMRAAEDTCVLLRGDDQYHSVRQFADRIDIFEGSIPSSEIQELHHILDAGELFQLKQEKISAPLIHYELDQLLVGVSHPGSWQNLRFPDSESRKSYRQSLDPLPAMVGFSSLGNHINLSDEGGRNNCLPPQKIELKTRPLET